MVMVKIEPYVGMDLDGGIDHIERALSFLKVAKAENQSLQQQLTAQAGEVERLRKAAWDITARSCGECFANLKPLGTPKLGGDGDYWHNFIVKCPSSHLWRIYAQAALATGGGEVK